MSRYTSWFELVVHPPISWDRVAVVPSILVPAVKDCLTMLGGNHPDGPDSRRSERVPI